MDKPRYFFRRKNRVRKRSEFLEAYAKGRSYRRRLVHVFVAGRESAQLQTRLGLTATRKVGGAVQRNRLKRLGREIFRLALPRMRSGYTIIVNFQRAALQAHFTAIESELLSVWQEAGVLSDDHRPDC